MESIANIGAMLADAHTDVERVEDEVLDLYSKRKSNASTDGSVKRDQIVKEIVDTERDLADDLNLCVQAYMNGPFYESLTPEQQDVLFCNLPEIQMASNKLSQQLASEVHVGKVFKELNPELKEVFLKYSVNYEEAQALLTTLVNDEAMKILLAECQATITTQTNTWDLTGFLFKPIQRFMKYPLLMKELLRKTEPTDPDFQDITDAQLELKAMVIEINEKKRTKELLEKYGSIKKGGPINKHGLMHSIAKKSMRINQKMRRAIIAGKTQNFDDYDRSEKHVLEMEGACKKLRRRCEDFVSAKFETSMALNEYAKSVGDFFLQEHFKRTSQQNNAVIEDICVALSNLSIETMAYIETVRCNITGADGMLAQLLDALVNPLRLVDKRSDKKLDYESYRRKFDLASKDPEKQAIIKPDLELAKNTFFALHDQLAEDLPRLEVLCAAVMAGCMRTIASAQNDLLRTVEASAKTVKQTFKGIGRTEDLLASMKSLLQPVVWNPADPALVVSVPVSDSVVEPDRVQPTAPAPRMARASMPHVEVSEPTEEFGNAICVYAFDAQNAMEISLKKGQRVEVVDDCDETGNTEWCKVETKFGKLGYVATAYLEEIVVEDEVEDEDDRPGTETYAIALSAENANAKNDGVGTATVLFAFEAAEDIELTVGVNQEVVVLKLEDPTGNDEWYLIRDQTGSEGYVPADFISEVS